jgi:fumarate reductase flavoprotein subunit
VVAGRVCGGRMGRWAAKNKLSVDSDLIGEAVGEQQARLDALVGGGTGDADQNIYDVRNAMQLCLHNKVGIFRKGEELDEAVDSLRQIYQQSLNLKVSKASRNKPTSPEIDLAMRLPGMVRVALTIAKGAQARVASRGGHTREDHPARDDANWLKRTLARWPKGADEPELTYEPVGLIELPPGERGYGGATMIKMERSVEDYNAAVGAAWLEAGWQPTEEPLGSELVKYVEKPPEAKKPEGEAPPKKKKKKKSSVAKDSDAGTA